MFTERKKVTIRRETINILSGYYNKILYEREKQFW